MLVLCLWVVIRLSFFVPGAASVSDRWTKKVTLLIVGDGGKPCDASSKVKKARENAVEIIQETDWINLLRTEGVTFPEA